MVSIPSASAEYIITGLKRPFLPPPLRRSTKMPAIGSMNASKILVKTKTPAAALGSTPATSV